jgi:hypothetical protein
MNELEIKNEMEVVEKTATEIQVIDKQTYEAAAEHVLNLDSTLKKIKEYWAGPKKAAYDAHKAITRKENEMLEPVEEVKKGLIAKINKWLAEESAKQRAEQARLDEERKKREEAERAKLEARAEKAEEKGKIEKAEALREKAEEVYIPPVMAQGMEKTTRTDAGTVSAKTVKVLEVVDPLEVIKAVAAGQIPVTMVEIKEAQLLKWAEMSGLKTLPGCKIGEESRATFRRKVS